MYFIKNILYICIVSLFVCCSSVKILNGTCNNFNGYTNQSFKKNVRLMIDSSSSYNKLYCDKRKRIISSKCENDTITIIKIKTRCNDYAYFYINKNLKIVRIVRQFKEIH
jgi:hypothetical protein